MTLKIDAKFQGKLTCGLENRNCENRKPPEIIRNHPKPPETIRNHPKLSAASEPVRNSSYPCKNTQIRSKLPEDRKESGVKAS